MMVFVTDGRAAAAVGIGYCSSWIIVAETWIALDIVAQAVIHLKAVHIVRGRRQICKIETN